MIYDISYPNNRSRILQDAILEGDDCPVDDICDSIPKIIEYINHQDDMIRTKNQEIQKLKADIANLERKLNNTKSQKFRIAKKKGKTLYR